jgi:hypothetical protein
LSPALVSNGTAIAGVAKAVPSEEISFINITPRERIGLF